MSTHAAIAGRLAAKHAEGHKKPFPLTAPTLIALLALTAILLHLVLRYLSNVSRIVWETPLLVALIAGGLPLVVRLTQKLFQGEFGSDHLAGISILTSVVLGEYLVGVIVILMLSGGTALEEFASRTASSVLDALARRMPQIAHRRTGHDVSDVKLGDIAVGDSLVVFPHETCPVDGVVVEAMEK